MPSTAVLPGAEPFSHTSGGSFEDGGEVGVLLCHGFTGSPHSMRPWAERLAAEGFDVELPLLPGHGTRWTDLAATGWPDWYAELERAFDVLRRRCPRVVVAGLSMGGTLALHLAAQRGDQVAGLVLVNPSVRGDDRRLVALPVLRLVAPSLGFPGIGNDVRREGVTELAYDRFPLSAVYSLSRLWRVVQGELAAVGQPILLCLSAVDHVVGPRSAAMLRAGVSSTDVTELGCANSFHVATLDNDAEAIFAGSVDFVRRVAEEG